MTPEALTAFWNWWASAKDRINQAIETRSLTAAITDEMSAAVRSLDPGFAWELGPGRLSRHSLTVTPEGNLELRRLTGLWLASAPPPDPIWEYYASRQAGTGLNLELGGKRFAADEFRVAFKFDSSRERFDIELHHPYFKRLPMNLVHQAGFLTLDECLGEDDVERWVGAFDTRQSQPQGATTLLAGLGDNALQIGRVTWAGRREIHFFVRDPVSTEASVEMWKRQLTPWSATHALVPDPHWTAAKEGIYAAPAPRALN